ncbi:helix-turn-helix transcriptional regulator [Methanolobus halotolerans]|uniref:Methanogenesis regulatory protein FilR1 middle domain-containing protein n=1 Tax=Methanolobus halotolerans TaxID=2052935 RepID=A0A4E0QQ44_9EURY|nr:transcriptional regulator FilR1 domain-containing protein [Methanolobus halotolerans]TGC06983.1 hypothetical protein CUN85_12315 [Methanolobus halotolerans]
MNDKSLETVITARNRSILLSLYEGPKRSDTLCTASGMDIIEFLSSIESLEKHDLVAKEEDIYRLNDMGKAVIEESDHDLCTGKLVENVSDYWQSRNLDFIPPHLLGRLHEIDICNVLKPPLPDIFDHNKEAHEAFKSSKSFDMIAVSMRPNFPDLFREMINRRVNLSIIFDPRFYDKLIVDNPEVLREFIGNRQVRLYRYPKDISFVSLKLSESCMVLQSLIKEGAYDYTQLLSCNPTTVAWAKELFEYYLKDSVPITEIK